MTCCISEAAISDRRISWTFTLMPREVEPKFRPNGDLSLPESAGAFLAHFSRCPGL
jgi:hypothetical protein